MVDPRIATASGTPRTNANRLRQVRVAAGMSQRQLAREAGVHRATVQRIERGDCQPTNAVIGTIAAALGVPVIALAASLPPQGAAGDDG